MPSEIDASSAADAAKVKSWMVWRVCVDLLSVSRVRYAEMTF